jgi:hypothetical protein
MPRYSRWTGAIRGEEVVRVLEGIKLIDKRLPKSTRIDNSPELV